MSRSRLLIATHNISKLREFRALLAEVPADICSLRDFPGVTSEDETGATFEEVATHKAEQACRSTGLISLADDSGLEVDALNGEPGIYSRRFLGEGVSDAERNTEILRRLQDVPPSGRTARFVCAIAIAIPQHPAQVVRGVCEGIIAETPRGDNGFGYDPIFYLPELGRTVAELSPEEKNQVSHRGRAARAAAQFLRHCVTTQGMHAVAFRPSSP